MYSYRVEQAIRAASILHKDQLRKGSIPLPYVTHLFAVALIVNDYVENEDILIAAFLHDTLEDTDYTTEELQEDFGGKIKDIVLAVTEPQNTEKKQYTWKEKKLIYSKQLKKAPEEVLFVAAADKIHNMRSIVDDYYDDHTRFINDFGGELDDRVLVYQEISNTLNRNLKNDIIAEFNHVFTEYKNFILNVKKTKEDSQGI